MKNDAQFMEYE